MEGLPPFFIVRSLQATQSLNGWVHVIRLTKESKKWREI